MALTRNKWQCKKISQILKIQDWLLQYCVTE